MSNIANKESTTSPSKEKIRTRVIATFMELFPDGAIVSEQQAVQGLCWDLESLFKFQLFKMTRAITGQWSSGYLHCRRERFFVDVGTR